MFTEPRPIFGRLRKAVRLHGWMRVYLLTAIYGTSAVWPSRRTPGGAAPFGRRLVREKQSENVAESCTALGYTRPAEHK